MLGIDEGHRIALKKYGDECPHCPAAVAVGVFDGVHLGHRTIFGQLIQYSQSHDLRSIALTFDKHPSELVAPDFAPLYISTLEQRIEMIQEIGVDEVVVAQFEVELANLSPDDFISVILIEKLNAKCVVVGADFRFGKKRLGDVQYLKKKCASIGIEVIIVNSVIIDNAPVSSTRIRSMISDGDINNASKLLGKPFVLRGDVVEGHKIGRTLGFPTANIQIAKRQVVPADGVYAVQVKYEDKIYAGACSIGSRPTYNDNKISIEVYLIDFDGDLYDSTIDTYFYEKIRDQVKFNSPEELVKQMKSDVEMIRKICF